MPYIKAMDYGRATRTPSTPGELNYAITCKAIVYLEGGSIAAFASQALDLCKSYITRHGLSYTIGNEVLGVIACSGLEVIRRCGTTEAAFEVTETLADIGGHIYDTILAPYEDGKIKENGDVYPAMLVG